MRCEKAPDFGDCDCAALRSNRNAPTANNRHRAVSSFRPIHAGTRRRNARWDSSNRTHARIDELSRGLGVRHRKQSGGISSRGRKNETKAVEIELTARLEHVVLGRKKQRINYGTVALCDDDDGCAVLCVERIGRLSLTAAERRSAGFRGRCFMARAFARDRSGGQARFARRCGP